MVDPRDLGAHCDLCPCNGRKPVFATPASGNLRLIVIGEGPAPIDVRDGAPFQGPAGDLLESICKRNGVKREELHLTNAYLCRPEGGGGLFDDEAKRATECCAPRLLREVAALPPATVVTLGAAPAKALLNAPGLLKTRGFVWTTPGVDEGKVGALERAAGRLSGKGQEKAKAEAELKAAIAKGRAVIAGRRVHPTLHPQFVLKSDLWNGVFERDIAMAVRSLPAKLDSNVDDRVFGGPYDVFRWVTGDEITLDIETTGLDFLTVGITCIGVDDGEHVGVLFPWSDEWAGQLSAWLRTKKRVIGHNSFNADHISLIKHGVDLTDVRLDDTLILHHAHFSHFPQNLGHVVSTHAVSEPWKHLSKGQGDEKGMTPAKMSSELLVKYNAQDARLTKVAWDNLPRTEMKVYEHDIRMNRLASKMILRGMPVDYNRLHELQEEMSDVTGGLLLEMRRLVGSDGFDPQRLEHVREAIYQRFNVQVTRRTKKELPATDKAVIESLRTSEGDVGAFARALARYRLVKKIRNTYLVPEHVGVTGKLKGIPLNAETGRAHYNWKAYGTVTGRLSCRAQSTPKYMPLDRRTKTPTPEGKVREVTCCGPGKRLVYYDGSQIQMRIAAYLSGDAKFMKACEGDVHSNNAAVLFPDLAKLGYFSEEGKKDIKRGKPYRDITKNTGFAVIFVAEDETVFLYLRSQGFPVEYPFVVRALSNLRTEYRAYFRWVTAQHEEVRKKGYLRTPILGRIMWLGWCPKITEVSADLIQGTEADVMTARMLEVEEKHGDWMPLIAQIHDACIYEVDEDKVEAAKEVLRSIWARPIPQLRNLVIPIDLKSGMRWSDFG